MATLKLDYSSLPMTTATANTTYVMDATQFRYLANGYMVDIAATQGLEFELNGSLYAGGALFKYGSNGQSAPPIAISVGKTGYLQSDNGGFSVYADDATVGNAGSIFAVGDAVEIDGDRSIVTNSGTIFSKNGYGVELAGADLRLENTGNIAGRVSLLSDAGSGATVVNSGQINGPSTAIGTGSGNDTVINSGLVRNEIRMYGGDDRFLDKGGQVSGAILGGEGDDLFVIRSKNFDLRESAGQGVDTVKSSVSWDLDQNFEIGRLMGTKNINLKADFGDVFLYGNAGKNTIIGAFGNDKIDGGKGDDTLTGRTGMDEFVFKRGTGDDVITDFQDGVDLIDLSSYKGIGSFGDLVLKQAGADVVISLLDGDTVTLKEFAKGDLSAADFTF